MLEIWKTFFRIIAKRAFRVCLTVILKSVFSLFNNWNCLSFKVLEMLETLSKIPIKRSYFWFIFITLVLNLDSLWQPPIPIYACYVHFCSNSRETQVNQMDHFEIFISNHHLWWSPSITTPHGSNCLWSKYIHDLHRQTTTPLLRLLQARLLLLMKTFQSAFAFFHSDQSSGIQIQIN